MKRIAILGCENSHADAFIKIARSDEKYKDVEIVGVYTDEPDVVERMKRDYGVYCAQSFDEFVGKVDGIMITARDGNNHYKYAKPYLSAGIPMFIDKPITSDADEAVEFMKAVKLSGSRICGGSSCPHAPEVVALAEKVRSLPTADVYGGFVRAPISMQNNYGGFFFYAQHICEVTLKIFGYYPKSVMAYSNANVYTVVIRYDSYDVVCEMVDGNYLYYAYASTNEGMIGSSYPVTSEIYTYEFEDFYDILTGGKGKTDYREFIAPVFVFNAIKKSIDSAEEVAVEEIGEI